MADDDDWRLRIDLRADEHPGLLERLGLIDSDADELADELRGERLLVSHDDDTVFVYSATPAALAGARKVIDRELTEAGLTPERIVSEHWLESEERWDGEPLADDDAEVLAEGYAPWEVRIPCRDRRQAAELAAQLEAEGYGVVRRWTSVLAGCASEADARALAERLHGEVELGGEVVWDHLPRSPFAILGGLFGGLGGTGTPI